eukprot:CAMPEP_0206373610 /NCGR_PEP_ID=MMETSP0294-20121207/7819_1 /ASSEMBLY_ACC=CAM_ASM_000327 /TAXON_ID=39354 /ORGANISM="Heterosigma akashiwo, Strain CCMP2393" /LENGTH=106 /DNA_ID=CAMNT_0053821237 /DNA_START=145 /DNA_END=462 /DNA_ORIENTATION=-
MGGASLETPADSLITKVEVEADGMITTTKLEIGEVDGVKLEVVEEVGEEAAAVARHVGFLNKMVGASLETPAAMHMQGGLMSMLEITDEIETMLGAILDIKEMGGI